MKIKYLVTYGGGFGPNTWDKEMVVEASSIREALVIVELCISVSDDVLSVEQLLDLSS